MAKRTPALVERWVHDIGHTLGIPESDWDDIRANQTEAVGRWARHIVDPDDVETYVMLNQHARRGFISRFPASRFLMSQMRFTQLVADEPRRELAHGPKRHSLLRQLLAQEFQERVLHITDFFVQGRED